MASTSSLGVFGINVNMSSTTENSIGKSMENTTGFLANREIVLGRRLREMAMTYLNMRE
jgi:hypothetical protein